MSRWKKPFGNGHHVQRMEPMQPNHMHETYAHPPPNILTVEQVEFQQRFNNQLNQGQPPHHFYNNHFGSYNYGMQIDVSNSNLQPTAQEFQPVLSAAAVPRAAAHSSTNHEPLPYSSTEVHHEQNNLTHTGAVRRNGPQNNRVKPKTYRQEKKYYPEQHVEDTRSMHQQPQPQPQRSGGYNKDRQKGYSKHTSENQSDWGNNTSRSNSNGYNNSYNIENKYNKKESWKSKPSDRSQHENWRQRGAPNQKNNIKTEGVNKKQDFVDQKAGGHVYKEDKGQKENNAKVSKNPNTFKKKLDAASQRERLEQMVTHRMLECLVCCEKLRHTDRIWSCKQCFHILHLNCTKQWAKSSQIELGWRCPACQNVVTDIPSEYRCYCGKSAEPKFEPGMLPHSCGEPCRKKGRNCDHTCTLLCHPGPCPDCAATVSRSCGCGRTSAMVKCKSTLPLVCEAVCDKLLNCGMHTCTAKCHLDDCGACGASVHQECYCGKQGRKVPCTSENQGLHVYACGDVCDKTLPCGNHKCAELCHAGPCGDCDVDVALVKTCPCGKEALKVERQSCLDPIPCCDNVCSKKLHCGQPSQPHLCDVTCHVGACPPCLLTTMVRCRCGHMDRELPCKDLTTKADDARCQKKCTKKRTCIRHKCNQLCCIDIDHICPLLCNRTLSCGLHRCELNCHKGRCPTCWRTSFQELYCECGASVIYPPVPCGTRSPECKKPCSRIRPCGHEPLHNCHTGACPPCSMFTTKLCHGEHESRGTIPCHQEDFSCGMPCNKEMPCGQHRCVQVCHKGPCPTPCTQPCTSKRANCGHNCNQPCHTPPCPSTPCKQSVQVTCECGLRSSTRVCMDLIGDYQRIAMLQLASKMADIQRGQSVDITDIVNKTKKGGAIRTLECNDECKLLERNRRMAIGLQIRNPDLSSKLTPRYSDYMKQWAKKDTRFCQKIHEKLTELVQLAKQSKQKSRSHSFECMNREKRHFVHEYCEHFGCDSAAYDAEPNRNIVATAYKDKSWLPSCSLIEMLQRENGQRKVPGPVMAKPTMYRNLMGNDSQSGNSVSLRLQSQNSSSEARARPSTPPAEFVDYFENPPQN